LIAVLARRKSSSQASRRLNYASLTASIVGVTVGAVVLLFVFVVLNPFGSGSRTYFKVYCNLPSDDVHCRRNRTALDRTTTPRPDVTSPSLCHVVENETKCFRFVSRVTAGRCEEVGGVTINSSSSSSAAAAAAARSTVVCYHNVCNDYVVKTSCFQHRLAAFTGQKVNAAHRIAASRNPSQSWDHMRSHSVTCHPTQVTAPHSFLLQRR